MWSHISKMNRTVENILLDPKATKKYVKDHRQVVFNKQRGERQLASQSKPKNIINTYNFKSFINKIPTLSMKFVT